MLGASVRVRTEPAGPSGDVLSISVLGADASTLGVGGSPGSMPAVLSSLQLAHVQLAGDPVPVVVGRAVVMRPQSVRPATIEMRVPAGEPGMEDAVAAARTVAHAALNAEAAPDRPALAGAPDAARRLRRRPLVASARVAATVLGILVAGMLLIWGASNLMTPDGGIWFGVMFMGPMAAIAAVYVLVPGRRGIPGLWARATHETWESGPHGLVSVESAADRRMAVALAIPASTLRAIEPWIAVDDAGGGEAVIQLMAGSREIRRVAVRSERGRAEAAANDLVATATGQPGTTEQR